MRCAVFAAVYLPFKGGYTESIHGLFSRLACRGNHVTVITCNTHNQANEETVDGVHIVRMPCWNPGWLNNSFPIPQPTMRTFQIIRKILSESYDFISTQTRFFPTSWLGFCIGKIKHVPIVHTERGATHSVISFRLVAWIATFIDHTFGWIIARFSKKTIGVSEASCDFLKHIGATQPTKIYNGVDIDFWRSNRSELGLQHQITLTFVGRLIYAKGVQDLFHAAANVKQLGSENIKINIIGDGPYRSHLELCSEKLGLKNNVTFLGEMSQPQIRDLLWQTDIFVNPSHSEGLPRSVMEAAAAGLAIVATDTGGTREVVPGGVLVPPADIQKLTEELALLVNDKPRQVALGKKNEMFIQTSFSWDKVLAQYEEVFSTI